MYLYRLHLQKRRDQSANRLHPSNTHVLLLAFPINNPITTNRHRFLCGASSFVSPTTEAEGEGKSLQSYVFIWEADCYHLNHKSTYESYQGNRCECERAAVPLAGGSERECFSIYSCIHFGSQSFPLIEHSTRTTRSISIFLLIWLGNSPRGSTRKFFGGLILSFKEYVQIPSQRAPSAKQYAFDSSLKSKIISSRSTGTQ